MVLPVPFALALALANLIYVFLPVTESERTARAAFENYLPCYSADGSFPDQSLKDLIQYELDRDNLKKEIPLSQVASRELLQQAQKELNPK